VDDRQKRRSGVKAAAPKFGGGVVGGLSDLKTTVTASDGESLNVPIEAQRQIANVKKTAKYVSNLKNVPGIQAGKCVYDRSLVIAKILWSVIFVVNIVWMAYKMLIAGSRATCLRPYLEMSLSSYPFCFSGR